MNTSLDKMSKEELEKQKLKYEIKKYKRAWIDILVAISSTLTFVLAIASIVYAFTSGILELERKTNELENLTIDYDNKKLMDKRDSLNSDIKKFEFEKQNLSDSIELLKKHEQQLSENIKVLNGENEEYRQENKQLEIKNNRYRDSVDLERTRHYNLALQSKETLKLYMDKEKKNVQTYEQYISLDKDQEVINEILTANIYQIGEKIDGGTMVFRGFGNRFGQFGENYEFSIGIIYKDLEHLKNMRIVESIDRYLRDLIYVNDLPQNLEQIKLSLECGEPMSVADDSVFLMSEFKEINEVSLYVNDSVSYKKELTSLIKAGNEWILYGLFVKNKFNLLGYDNVVLVDNPQKFHLMVTVSVDNLFIDYYKNLSNEDKQKVQEKYAGHTSKQ